VSYLKHPSGPFLYSFDPRRQNTCNGKHYDRRARGTLFFFLFVFVFFFCLLSLFVVVVVAISWAAPAAYGVSQARGPIGAIAAGLHQRHSNAGSEPRLQPTPQLTATPDR